MRSQKTAPKIPLVASTPLGSNWMLEVRSTDDTWAMAGFHFEFWLRSYDSEPQYVYIDSTYLDVLGSVERMARQAHKDLFHLPGPHRRQLADATGEPYGNPED